MGFFEYHILIRNDYTKIHEACGGENEFGSALNFLQARYRLRSARIVIDLKGEKREEDCIWLGC